MSEPKTTRCTDCGAELTDAEAKGIHACPSCGTVSIPCLISQDVTIKINWHELRVLTIWATNWAQLKFPEEPAARALGRIIAALNAQKPDLSFAPLTLAGELQELADALGMRAEMHQGERVTIFEGKKPS